ncbi:MAG: DUF547 domain-containing protein [Ferruginibacter sp.]|nr:DUF547 domain-containing protein [Ferruginibacter sp.]
MKRLLVLLNILFLLSGCTFAEPGTGIAPTHEKWSALLQRHVSPTGVVNYKGFKADLPKLKEYLDILSRQQPASNWTKNESLAFWINAYNAFTVKLIVDNYPVKSIKDLNPGLSVIFVNTIWDKNFFSIGGNKMSLNDIEHRRLRKMNEPRIHFAIVCASKSCPRLLNSAYEAGTLDQQLTAAGRNFLADPFKNKPAVSNPKLSKIFDWFSGDFSSKGKSKIDFINQFINIKIDPNTNISYLDYDWSLNDR